MPARLRAIVAAFKQYGGQVEEPSSGSHFKAVRDGVTYPIPAHNGLKTEISDAYIRGLCRAFAIDYAEFKRRL